MTVSLDKLYGTTVVKQGNTAGPAFTFVDSMILDKFYASATIKQGNTASASFRLVDSMILDKFYATVAIRPAIEAHASGSVTVSGAGAFDAIRSSVASAIAYGVANAVPRGDVILVPSADDDIGGWKNQSNSTPIYVSLAKYNTPNDVLYAQGMAGNILDTARVKLSTPPFTYAANITFDYRIAKYPLGSTAQVDMVVTLQQNTTTIVSWTHTNLVLAPSNVTQTLTPEQRDAITDFSDLYLVFTSIATGTEAPTSTASSVGSASGTVTAVAASSTDSVISSLAFASGTSTASGVFEGIISAVGSASGTGAAPGVAEIGVIESVATAVGSSGDPLYNNVKLLVDFAGPENGTSFTDRSPAARTLTTAGNARTHDNRLELDGVTDYVSAPDSPDWQLTGDFTLEVFGVQNDDNAIGPVMVSHYDAYSPATNQRGWALFYRPAGELDLVTSTTGTSPVANPVSFTMTNGVTYDIAVERSGSTVRYYVDGVMVGSLTQAASTFNTGSPLVIGSVNVRATGTSNQEEWVGYIRAVRFTQGVARYASDGGYTVPKVLPASVATVGSGQAIVSASGSASGTFA